MQITVKLASILADILENQEKISRQMNSGATVGGLLLSLSEAYPGFRREEFYAASKISDKIMVFVNGNNVKHLQGADTILKDGDLVYIIPTLAGG